MNAPTHSILRVVRHDRDESDKRANPHSTTSEGTFCGSAIYLGGCYAITCWHVLVDREHEGMDWSPSQMLREFEFEVSFSDRCLIAHVDSVPKQSPRHQHDLVLLKLQPSDSEPWPEVGMRLLGEVPEAFMGSREDYAGVHLTDCDRAEACGYPGKSDGTRRAVYEIDIVSFQNRGWDDDTGLLMDWQLRQGGLLAGLSGGAIIGFRREQAACLGMPYLGGAGAATSRVTVSNEIIEFIRDEIPPELLEQIVLAVDRFLPDVTDDLRKGYQERLRAKWESKFRENPDEPDDGRTPFIATQGLTLLTSPGDPRPHLRPEYFRSRRSGVAEPIAVTGQAEMLGTQERAWQPIARESLVTGNVKLKGYPELALKRMVLTTDAGVGKTTNLKWLAMLLNQESNSKTVAFVIDPEAWQQVNKADNWLERLATLLLTDSGDAGTDAQQRRREQRVVHYLRAKRDEGTLVILLDGLDHATPDQIWAIKQLLGDKHWATCRVIVGGRPHALQRHWRALFEGAPSTRGASDWRFVQASEFSEEEQRQYLGAVPGVGDRFDKVPPEARSILGVPRVLEYLRELPEEDLRALRTPSDVYWKSTRRLIARGMENNAVAHQLGGRLPGADRIDIVLELLAAIAFQMTATRVVSADGETHRDNDNSTDAGQPPTLRPNFDSIPPTQYAGFRDLIWARMRSSRRYDRRFDQFTSDLNGLAAMNTVLSHGFFDNDTSDGLQGIIWRDRSFQEFFAAVWLSRYFDCRPDYSDSDGKCLQSWIFTPDDVASEEYYEIWQFAAEMPEEGRNGLSWVRSLGVIYRPGDGAHTTRRSNEMIYRSWETMRAYCRGRGGEDAMKLAIPVLNGFQSEFESIILTGKRGEKLRKQALEFIASFVELEGDPNFQMGSPQEKQGRMPEESQKFWKKWLTEGQEDRDAHVNRLLDRFAFPPGIAGEKARADRYTFFVSVHERKDFDGIRRQFFGADETPLEKFQPVDGFKLSHSPTLNCWYRLYDPGHGLRLTEYRESYGRISGEDASPAVYVTWYEAWAFCRWAFWESVSCRLPSELEWEYAAKGGRPWDWDYWWHKTDYDPQRCNANTQAGKTLTPAAGRSNPFGLRDMLGNVQEWCADCYRRQFSRGATDATPARVLRGGSWGDSPSICRSAGRNDLDPTGRLVSVGFRVARASSRKT